MKGKIIKQEFRKPGGIIEKKLPKVNQNPK
jgi:hypothetical protein